MSFDKIKNLWRSAHDKTDESFIEKTQNFFTSTIKKQETSIEQFDQYLKVMPSTHRRHSKKKLSTTTTLRPQLLVRCYENVEKEYFSAQYQFNQKFFQKNRRANKLKQTQMHEQLDEVEICLFNQITSRFDEILSVLRTIQSLQCIVTEHQNQLKFIRENNMSQLKSVTKAHAKINRIIKKKEHLQRTLQQLIRLKLYAQFIKLQPNINDTTSQYYDQITEIKKNQPLYLQIHATKNFEAKIQSFETSLRQSFSDTLNEMIFKYVGGDIPYDEKYWKKFAYRMDIFEDRNQNEGSVILDDTMLADDEIISKPSRKQEQEKSLLYSLQKGWEEGQYSVQLLKIKIQKTLRGLHQKYLLEFRNFCNEACQRNNKQVDNPSLPNLLKEMSVSFCSKAFSYFFDVHKSILLRVASIYGKVLTFIFTKSMEEINIEKKQKLTLMVQGFTHIFNYIFKSICDKSAEIIDMKKIYETTDISEFKNVISVMEGIEEFIQTKLHPLMEVHCPQQSFLVEKAELERQSINTNIVKKAKEQKLFIYLNKMHKNAIESQLKDSLLNQIWQPTDIPTFYYDSLHYLISGESLNLRRNKSNLRGNGSMMFDTSVLMDSMQRQQSFFTDSKTLSNFRIIRNDIIIDQKTYKITTTVLLILEIIEDYMTLAHNFPILKEDISKKINQIIRSYNASSCQLIVHAGAVALKKLKTNNINSRHLALSSLCLSFLLYIMSCISKRIQIFESNKLQEAILEHIASIINKLNQILLFKVRGCKTNINLESTPSKGTEVIVNSTKILYDILTDYYDESILSRIFSAQIIRIYINSLKLLKISSRVEAEALKDDIAFFFNELKFMEKLSSQFVDCRVQAEDLIREAFQQL